MSFIYTMDHPMKLLSTVLTNTTDRNGAVIRTGVFGWDSSGPRTGILSTIEIQSLRLDSNIKQLNAIYIYIIILILIYISH